MTPLEIFRLVATEFQEVEDAEVVKWMELAKPFVSKKKFGNTYDHAIAYLTAHKLKMAGKGDNTMGKVDDALRVSSFSEGDASIGFSVSQGNNMAVDAEYALTIYGLQYLSIRRQRIIPIISAGES
jgi:hypothetical protein